jgi:DNA-binding NarL/FixJ family response regulator
MPGMNGVELASMLRDRYPGISLLAFTGSSGTHLMKDAYRVFDRVFDKSEGARVVAEVVELLRLEACAVR